MTVPALEKRLRLLADTSKVRISPLKKSLAQTTFENGTAMVTLPSGHDDFYLLRTLLHELAHLACPGELSAWGDLEEDILERVVEPRLMAHILSRPRAHAWWLKRLRALDA